MAKVLVDGDSVDIRVSWLERLMLSERPMRIPLSQIRSVDPHPRVIDMIVHWADTSGPWLGGVSEYDGQLVPSAKNPSHTLAIDLHGEQPERLYVEVDDEPTDHVAARIRLALHEARGDDGEPPVERPSEAQLALARLIAEDEQRWANEQAEESSDDGEQDEQSLLGEQERGVSRSALLPFAPQAAEAVGDAEREFSRLGGWLVVLGSVGVLSGTTIVAAGMAPGMLAVGAGVACGVLGAVALTAVSHREPPPGPP